MKQHSIAKVIGTRLRALSERIAKLEESALIYRGAWQAETTYQKGNFVTFRGSVWHYNGAQAAECEDITCKPPCCWTLAVKGNMRGGKAHD